MSSSSAKVEASLGMMLTRPAGWLKSRQMGAGWCAAGLRLTMGLLMIQSSTMTKYEQVYKKLLSRYGEPSWRPHLSPIDELVSTILSQNTNDTNRDRAFASLKDRYGSWDAVLVAPTDEIAETIRSAGLAKQKAPRIQNALRVVRDQQGEISLSFLADLELEEARQWLVSLPGVGPKTAAIVLLFGFGRPAFPVDTHVHRVTRRLGLIPPTMSAEKAHLALEEMVSAEHYYPLHLNLIRHGRETCQARKPKCGDCVLQTCCDLIQAPVQSERK